MTDETPSTADEPPSERIASLAELPEEGTFLFRVVPAEAGVDVEREAVLIRTGGHDHGDGGNASGSDGDEAVRHRRAEDGVAAWLNYCQHFTHIKLDKGGGAPVRNGEILCTNHGAMFEADTGLCTHGPCEGAYLNPLDVRVEEGEVYLDDDDYAFAGLGPTAGKLGDLSSTSNVEF